jgi:3-mercaptopyruvate sulfurtransferase SseA
VRIDQTVTYVLTGVILPEQLEKIMAAQGLSQDRIVVAFDRAGVIGARSRELDRFLGKKLSQL